jgi:hypothetical protein
VHQDVGMVDQCYIKGKSNPPVCGVHNVRIVKKQASHEQLPGGVGNFTFLACPMSNQAVEESDTRSSDTDDNSN